MATSSSFSSVAELAQGSATNELRYTRLVQQFESKYGRRPLFVARAPGRVNLIGEHIDYCGYGVLPMAIEQDLAIACSPSDSDIIELANVDAHLYVDFSCPSNGYVIDQGRTQTVMWYNYFLCGHKGVAVSQEEKGGGKMCGMQVLVDGNIPPSSGLSSSSAMVCCSSLATIIANKFPIPSKSQLAEDCARSERFIGTIGGGMDQAISFLAEKGSAFMINFNPIRPSKVQIPPGYEFVVANSLVSANKAASSSRFNDRVVECRLAAKVIATKKGLDWRSVNILKEVQDALRYELGQMNSVVEECLHQTTYSKEEVGQILGVAPDKLIEEVLPNVSEKAKIAAKEMTEFKLFQRASHVFSEAYRVVCFKSVANNVGSSDPAVTAAKLGDLMNQSHDSCRDLYECSCSELDELVSLCKSSGALGARLTGAGWGGCVVCLVPSAIVSKFVSLVASSYYHDIPNDKVSANLFATQPGPGADMCVFQ